MLMNKIDIDNSTYSMAINLLIGFTFVRYPALIIHIGLEFLNRKRIPMFRIIGFKSNL